jgi:hypothetical protein
MRCKVSAILNNDQGMVLIMALVLMGLMSALAGAYAMLVRADTVLSGGASRVREGFYAAEAGLNVAMAETRSMFDDFNIPGAQEGSLTLGSGSQERTIDYNLTPVAGCSPCAQQTIPAGELFAGLNSIPYQYTVTSTAENAESEKEAELGAQFVVHNIPIFQFLAFFANDLEIQPAVAMDLHGRMHTNGNLYLNAGTTLTVGDLPTSIPNVQVTAGGNVFRKRKDDNTCSGTVTVDKLEDSNHDGNLDPLTLACNGGTAVSKATLAAYKGSLKDGVSSIQVPDAGILARGSGNIYWDRADLRIVLRLDLAKASIPFNAFCPATATTPVAAASPLLYPIEVQDASGTANTAKTNSLKTFMCQRRGAIFYTDVPTNTASPQLRSSYSPNFLVSDSRVYRRVGEDTNGDGIVDTNHAGGVTNSDRNADICPVSLAGVAAATKPWWTLDDCAWPNTALVATSWFQDTDYRRGGFFNARENKWMYLLNVNMRALIDWNEANGGSLFSSSDSSDGGLVIFLSVQGANSNAAANNYGVRVFDSADLNSRGGTFAWSAPADPTGLTVVSDQALYVEGNYNSYQKYPAAVMSDSLNVLSQGWEVPIGGLPNDRKSTATLTSNNRDVPATDGPAACGGGLACGNFTFAINAAFISGLDNTTAGGGNSAGGGGFQNYPRFHEDWSLSASRTLTYKGSFVTLGIPKHVNGHWCCNGDSYNMYNPPVRNWDYDAAFNDVRWLPPLTPKFTYVQQKMYTRFYK